MSSDHNFKMKTMLVHGNLNGRNMPSPETLSSHAFPIFQTSTFVFDGVKQAQEVFSGTDPEHEAYSRISNPNHRYLEERLVVLEGGEAAQVFDSGMTAIKVLIESLTKQGDKIIAHKSLYGGTYELFRKWGKFGVESFFVDAGDPENVGFAVKNIWRNGAQKVKMIFLETPSNPTLDICDISRIKEGLKNIFGCENVLLVVDNTFATPCNQQPLTIGADIVVHSLTKYLNGFGNYIGGSIVTSDKLMKRIWEGYRASGGAMDAEVASRIAVNMESVFDRIKWHNENGMKVARYLRNHSGVKKVYYPGLAEHPNHNVAKRQMTGGFGGMVSFELDGNQEQAEIFLNQLAKDKREKRGIITLSVSLGTTGSLIICPALTTHFNVPKSERINQGISDTLIRMSVGVEDIDDIVYSLERGFLAVYG